jgi:hypothetical protein
LVGLIGWFGGFRRSLVEKLKTAKKKKKKAGMTIIVGGRTAAFGPFPIRHDIDKATRGKNPM